MEYKECNNYTEGEQKKSRWNKKDKQIWREKRKQDVMRH